MQYVFSADTASKARVLRLTAASWRQGQAPLLLRSIGMEKARRSYRCFDLRSTHLVDERVRGG